MACCDYCKTRGAYRRAVYVISYSEADLSLFGDKGRLTVLCVCRECDKYRVPKGAQRRPIAMAGRLSA